MIRSCLVAPVALLLLSIGGGRALAQSANSIEYPAGYAPGMAPCIQQTDGSCPPVSATSPMPTAPKRENLALVNGDVVSMMTAYGGTYILNQGCAAYNGGSLALRYRGPDGITMLTLATKAASDTAGGTLVSLGSNALIDVALPAGASGCNVSLARVP